MAQSSAASTRDNIENIASMTGEVFNIHGSVMVRHDCNGLGYFFSFLEALGLPCAADGKEVQWLCDKLARNCLPMTI